MIKTKVKRGSAVLLALSLAFSVITLSEVRAANRTEPDRKCSVSFQVGGEYADLKTNTVDVNLYKVASIDVSGDYTATADFSKVDVGRLSADDDTAANTWLERAADAAAVVEEKGLKADAFAVIEEGTATVTDLSTGLYLVMAQDVIAENYTYTFTPYLVSLPNNYYYSTGDDTWVYDLTGSNAIGLKPEQTPRIGDLQIIKTIEGAQTTTFTEKGTFVFQIDITTLEGKTENRVESITFDGTAVTETALIEDIPAGATVVVNEVYSGASYKLVSENNQTAVIVATDEGSTNDPASVTFVNSHDNTPDGGYGIRNNFSLDENGQYQYNGSEQP